MRRVAVVAQGKSLDDQVGDCFGKTNNVAIVHWENGQIKQHENYPVIQSQDDCVGPTLATELASNYRVEAVLTEFLGCSAYDILSKKGVDVLAVTHGKTVRETVDLYFNGSLDEIEAANSPGGSRCGGNCGGCDH